MYLLVVHTDTYYLLNQLQLITTTQEKCEILKLFGVGEGDERIQGFGCGLEVVLGFWVHGVFGDFINLRSDVGDSKRG